MKKLLLLLPMIMMFILTLSGCGSSSSVVIRNMSNATPTMRTQISQCAGDEACVFSALRSLPTVDSRATLSPGGGGLMMGEFYMSLGNRSVEDFDTRWELTIDGVPQSHMLTPREAETFVDVRIPATSAIDGEIRLTAISGSSRRTIILDPPGRGIGIGSQRH